SFQLLLPCNAMDFEHEEETIINKILQDKNLRAQKLRSEKEILQKENDDLKLNIINLSNSLTEADDLINFIIQSPPTVLSYLSAFFNQAPEKELSELFTAATHVEFIEDIIVGGEIKFKAGS